MSNDPNDNVRHLEIVPGGGRDPEAGGDPEVEDRAPYEDLDRAAAQLAFLSEASRVLNSSLDEGQIFAGLTELVVPHLCDACTVCIVRPNGMIERVAAAHLNPDKAAILKRYERTTPPDPEARIGPPYVIRTGRSEFVTHLHVPPAEKIDSYAGGNLIQDVTQHVGVANYMTVPIRAGDEILGAIWFANSEPHRELLSSDLTLAEELGRRAGAAIRNAQLHRTAVSEAERGRVERRVRKQLVSDFVHDSRTPLTAARLNVELLIRRAGDPGGADPVRLLRRALENIDRTIRMLESLESVVLIEPRDGRKRDRGDGP